MPSFPMRIIEIFKSIQGEGIHQGAVTGFLRLGGCNLRCTWCDTPHAQEGGREVTREEVVQSLEELRCRRVCITGGEPLLQADEVVPLLQTLRERGYSIDIETNGTLDFSRCQPYAGICMDVKCPSSGETSDLELLDRIRPEDSVKFVVNDTRDCQYAEQVIREHPMEGQIFFSPVSGADYGEIVKFLVDRDLPVRLQVQLHKILEVR